MTPVLVDPKLTPGQAYHPEYGSPVLPAPGFKWAVNSTTGRLLPAIADEPSRFWTPKLRYRWHPDAGHYSLMREDDDDGDGEDTLYEYDIERRLFNRHQPSLEPESGTPRQRLFVRRPDGTYTDIVYDYYPTMNRLVPITK